MADLLRVSRNISRLTRPQRGSDDSLTDYEREMKYGYIPQAKAGYQEEKKKKSFFTVVLDVLQAGNYMSANAWNEVHDSIKQGRPVGEAVVDTLKAAWRGMTLQDKTTFADVIRQNAEEYGEFAGLTPEQWDKPLIEGGIGQGRGKVGKLIKGVTSEMDLAGLLGFAGDVAFDPATYISPLSLIKPLKGATTGAKAAGKAFGKDVGKLKYLMQNIDDLRKLKGIPQKVLDTAETISKSKGADAAFTYLQKKGGDNFSRMMNEIIKESTRSGTLGRTGSLARAGIGDVTEQAYKGSKGLQDEMLKAMGGLDESVKQTQTFQDLMKSVERGYGDAGERGMHFLRNEFAKSVREPNILAQKASQLSQLIGDTGFSGKFKDVWWNLLNNPRSPVAMLRKAFGIRNPYQTMLNVMQQDARKAPAREIFDLSRQFDDTAEVLGDDLLYKAIRVRSFAEESNKKIITATAEGAEPALRKMDDFLNDPSFLKRLDMSPEETNKIRKFWTETDKLIEHMNKLDIAAAESGAIPSYEALIGYLHKYENDLTPSFQGARRATGTASPGYVKHTEYTAEQSIAQGVAKLKLLYGEDVLAKAGYTTDDMLAKLVTEKNLAPISTDIRELMHHRIQAHGRTQQRVQILDQFKEFGFNWKQGLKDTPLESSELGQMLDRKSGSLPELGLFKSKDEALDGYLFDKDVVDVIDKTFDMVNSDESIGNFKKFWQGATGLWKASAVMTSGFHLRNMFSNDVQGFFMHGTKWFDPNKSIQGVVGAAYAQNPTKYIDILTGDLKIGNETIQRVLNQRLKGTSFTVRELADYAREKGVMSAHTFFSDITQKTSAKKLKGLQKFTPISQDFVGFKFSREVGDIIENSAKFKSFLIGYSDLAGEGLTGEAVERLFAESMALEYSKDMTRKFFIDYDNLTDFERKLNKNFIPFYTWTRNNLSNQLIGLTMWPEMFAFGAKARRAATAEGFDWELQPDWQKTLGYFPVGKDEQGQNIMMFPNFPSQELAKMPLSWGEGQFLPRPNLDVIGEQILNNAHPLIKSGVETLLKYNTFKRREMLEEVEAPELAQFLANSPKVLTFLDGVLRTAGLDGGMRTRIEKDGRVMMDERMEKILSNNLPILRLVGNIVDLGIDIGGFESLVQASTGRKDEYEGLTDLLQALSYFGGVKLSVFEEEQAKEWRDREIEAEAIKQRNRDRKRAPGQQTQRAGYAASREAQRRRIGL